MVSIDKECFYNMSNLEVFIPCTLTQDSAFSGVDSIHKVGFAEGYEKIPDKMFHLCFNLVEVIIPDNLKAIGVWSFMDSGIKSIKIPQNCTVQLSAFAGAKLESVEISFPIKMEISVGIGKPNIITGEYKNREIITVEATDMEHFKRLITKEYRDSDKFFTPFNHTPFENHIIKNI